MLKRIPLSCLVILGVMVAITACSGDTDAGGSGVQTTPPVQIPQQEFTTLNSLRFDLSAAEVTERCDRAMQTLTSEVEKIEALADGKVSIQNTLLALEEKMADFFDEVGVLVFLKSVSPEESVRKAAEDCEVKQNSFFVDLFARENLYARLKLAESKEPNLRSLEARLLKETLLQFKGNGLDLKLAGKTDEFMEFATLKKKVADLGTAFETELNNWNVTVKMTKEELAGLPQSYIDEREKVEEGGKSYFLIGLDYPAYIPFMQMAKDAAARKKLQNAYDKRGGEINVERLSDAVAARARMAQLLGYQTHADFVLETRMAKNKEAVVRFLTDLKDKLQPKGHENLNEMLAAKQEDLGAASDGTINAWDWRYYENYLRTNKYKVDNNLVKEYFPHDIVTKGMLDIYQEMLSVKFVPDTRFKTWHADVMSYRIEDNGKTVAYFFLDMYPREGKYKHAAMSGFVSGRELPDGSYRAPVAAVMANMPKPSKAGERALWSHSDVETLFHEFGHVMHGVLTRAKYASFAGTNVKRDFVEAPSQVLENWVWQKESLQRMSGHYLDPKKKLPDELLEKMLNAKLLNVGIFYLRQLSFGLFDMALHTQKAGEPMVDTTEAYRKQMAETMLIPIQDGTFPQASFGHMMGGYDAGYYGYLWSEVYAADMFTRFESEGLLSPKAGMDYRRWILEKGGSEDPFDLLRGFLGREPNSDAFLKSLGLTQL